MTADDIADALSSDFTCSVPSAEEKVTTLKEVLIFPITGFFFFFWSKINLNIFTFLLLVFANLLVTDCLCFCLSYRSQQKEKLYKQRQQVQSGVQLLQRRRNQKQER